MAAPPPVAGGQHRPIEELVIASNYRGSSEMGLAMAFDRPSAVGADTARDKSRPSRGIGVGPA